MNEPNGANADRPNNGAQPVLRIEDFTKRYGEHVILEGINAEIEKGEAISIIGGSGVGKSTFLRGLNMLDPPSSGAVYLDGERIGRKNLDRMRRRMGMVFQNFGLYSNLDILGNVTVAQMDLLKRSKDEARAVALELLAKVGLSDRAHHYPKQLSGGQKQRAAIARCLAMSPEIILFDEPTSALDPTMVGEVTSVIRQLAENGFTMLIVTHEMRFAREVSSRVFFMAERGIYEQGTAEQIFEHPQRELTAAFMANVHL